jgi:hypothetical protein
MARIYKTAQGKSVDIDSLRLQNEETIAVGNMKVNARGDQLGTGGQITQSRNQTMNQHYKIQTASSEDDAVRRVQEQQRQAGARITQGDVGVIPPEPEVDPSGVSFDPVPETTPTMRGSLADSIAKQVTVSQELLDPKPNAPKGPQRI